MVLTIFFSNQLLLLVEIVSLEADMAVMEVFGYNIKDLQGIGRIIKNRIILKEVK